MSAGRSAGCLLICAAWHLDRGLDDRRQRLGGLRGDGIERGPAALDVPRWLELTADRRRPSWHSPHEIVFEAPIARLRDFSSDSSAPG